ncbi:hypothetical protein [Adhaeribacter soli]|uniref:Uncharacterized protein n=1 Tax=Adhaeribacter soli TaxID=2607655 RepID=A0A5N1J1A7_9BACT|nr:hypothetical protein [Adhaeribacter soli]KAA9340188.1 hypothetical protein F0P94_07520 [Adhaeribacter soli]
MKKMLYLFSCCLYLGFSGCRKEGIKPGDAAPLPEKQQESCTSYGYQTKTEPVALGPATGAELLVGFRKNFPLKQQQRLLATCEAFQAVSGQVQTASGPVSLITLKPGTTCHETEKLMHELEQLPAVRFSLPGLQAGTYSDEFVVSLQVNASETEFLQLVADTRTHIVTYPEELGSRLYLLSADKSAAGNVFEMVSFFNDADLVEYASLNGPLTPLTSPDLIAFRNPTKQEVELN